MTTITSKQLPSPKGQAILGHIKEFNVPNKHQVLENWAAECGDLFKIHFLGKQFIVSANNHINKEILKMRPQKFRRFNKIDEILSEMGVKGVFNAEGEPWKQHRLVVSEALNYKNIKTYFPVIRDTTKVLQNKWKKAAERKELTDVQKDMMKYTVDITTTIAFGYPMNTLEQENDSLQQHLEKIFPMINSRITAPIPYWRFIKLKKDKELNTALSELQKTVQSFIDHGKKRLEEEPNLKLNPTNFLEALLSQQETNSQFNDKEVFGNVFTMLLAGEDTTSNSISWSIYYLAQHPEIVHKIREELSLKCTSQFPETFDELKDLKYTEAVALETLRIQPVTPNLYFEALEDVQIDTLKLTKGEVIMLQNKVAQTHENNFVSPNQFIPERWLKTGCPVIGNHKPSTMLTFGAGPRFCPGKNLAIHEMVVAISMIASQFDFSLAVAPEEVKEIFSFTMYPENLLIKLKNII